ncbi:MAG: energy transducer TonB [Plesiomonas sp.]|uniref:energy transducer TonB n=1 Tax=Plesiomonas sp. TaxID=2486279 RepID=UPI003F2B0830
MWISSEKKRLLVASGICLCAHTVLLLVGFQPLQTRAITLDTLSSPTSASRMVLTLATAQRAAVNPTEQRATLSDTSLTNTLEMAKPELVKNAVIKEKKERKESVMSSKNRALQALPFKTPLEKITTPSKTTPEKKADTKRSEQPKKSEVAKILPTKKQQDAVQTTTHSSQNTLTSSTMAQTHTTSPSLSTTLNSESKPRFRIPPAPPEYPTAARARRQEGTTLLDITLGVHGELLTVVLTRSSGSLLLDKAALKAVQKWQFLPKEINGVGIKHTVRIPIRFELT